jgi:3',5'-cyclic AMP phosphodiesterase CpdA
MPQWRLVAAGLTVIGCLCAMIYPATSDRSHKPLLSFSVLSDIHIKHDDRVAASRFLQALEDHRNINPHSSLMVLNGDLTNGYEADYRQLGHLLSKVPHPAIHATMGNHEYYQLWRKGSNKYLNPDWSSGKAKKLFQNFFGYGKPYHDLWLNGYHFIFLSGERYRDESPDVREDAFLSREQLAWLDAKLREKAPNSPAGQPVFVFLHQPLAKSLEGTWVARGVVQDVQLREILRAFPQAILFSGHTHFHLDARQFVHDSYYMAGTGSVRQVRERHKSLLTKSESLAVEVYADAVVIRKREHLTKQWIYPNVVIPAGGLGL